MTRPTTRGGCADVPRPCPYVSCRWHLFFERAKRSGVRKAAAVECPTELPAELSCSLDVADEDGATLERIGDALGLTRERVRQLEVQATAKLGPVAERLLGDGGRDKIAAARRVTTRQRSDPNRRPNPIPLADTGLEMLARRYGGSLTSTQLAERIGLGVRYARWILLDAWEHGECSRSRKKATSCWVYTWPSRQAGSTDDITEAVKAFVAEHGRSPTVCELSDQLVAMEAA